MACYCKTLPAQPRIAANASAVFLGFVDWAGVAPAFPSQNWRQEKWSAFISGPTISPASYENPWTIPP